MKKVTIAFIILVIMLFGGIFVMMEPDQLGVAGLAKQDEATLKSIVRVGAYLTVIGLIGLAILGFVISSPKNGREAEVKDKGEGSVQNGPDLKK